MLIASRHGNRVELFGSSILEWLAYGLAVFLILFPKGGFKAGSIPLTWGYGLLGFAILLGLPFWLIRRSTSIPRASVVAWLCLVPVQLLFLYTLPVNGIEDFGFAISDIVAFFVLPFAFLVIFPQFLPRIRIERLIVLACWLIFLAAAYGIFLFAWRLVTGSYLEIPFLTVNIGDLGTLEDKFNNRPDGLFKLISTYNNGNQYGVATLLLLPLFDTFEHSRLRKLVVWVALMMTLSRTVWIGLVLNEAINIVRLLGSDLLSSPRLIVRHSSLFRVGGLLLLSVVVLGMTYLFSGLSFLFDSSLGGRSDLLENFSRATLLPTAPLTNFLEIIYASAASMLGWAGVAAVILLFCSPLFLVAAFKELRRTPLQVAACQGLVLYIFLAAMDGALNYIPTMAFYWFLWMLFIYGGRDQAYGATNHDSRVDRSPVPTAAIHAAPQSL
jgi:hypothetical protein